MTSPPAPQGGQLEPRLGLLPFARLIAELALVSSALYLAAAAALVRAAPALGWPLWRACAVGFSGVLFGLKVRLGAEGGRSEDREGGLLAWGRRAGAAAPPPSTARPAPPHLGAVRRACVSPCTRPAPARPPPVGPCRHAARPARPARWPAPRPEQGGEPPSLPACLVPLFPVSPPPPTSG